MAAKIYTDEDASLAPIEGKTMAVIGFGSQGHAHAQNLKDSGMNVIIGLYPGSKSREVAEKLGFEVMDTADAVKKADVIFIATPDTAIPKIYHQDVEPYLADGKTLLFSHGFAVIFGGLSLPKNVNVIMVAPKGPGHVVRSMYVDGKGVPALIAVENDATGNAKDIALAWAKGIGAARAGVFETNFREETVTDLFGEQTVLCGGVTALIKAGFETLVEAGYQPEMAYFECLHEMKLIVDLINEAGLAGMRFSISETAEWGDVTVGPKIIDASVKERMKEQLKVIESGEFAKDWIAEYENGYPRFNKIREEEAAQPIEKVGERLRGTMSWLKNRHFKKGETSQASYVSDSK